MRLQMREDPLQRPAVQGDQGAILHRPAEPAGSQAEGGHGAGRQMISSGGTSCASREPMP